MTRTSVAIQITPESKPAMPTFMGEAAAFAQVLAHTGILKTIQNEVRFARARFGCYDVIDFVVALIVDCQIKALPQFRCFASCRDMTSQQRMAPGADKVLSSNLLMSLDHLN